MSGTYETDPGAPPPQSRTFAVVLLVALVLVATALTGWLIWYLLRGGAEHGAYEAAPECAIGETEVLTELVPDHDLEIEESVGSTQDTFGTGSQCRWATPREGGTAVPAAATLMLVAAPVEGGDETTADTLESTAAGNEPRPVDDLGDEALTWVEIGAFEVGCTGVRVSNLYLESCYTASTDYDAVGSVDGEAAAAESERLVRSIVAELPEEIEADETD
ncbi:hypothetical protein [Nocardiopsis listeri]|uniref:hypothetical protein n=1 Tax=Nocardiopsis listeri TaxID=53440 RepID=UPI0008347944|nr:hypothetical protein [Nocardiopsis listeri]